MSDSDESRPKDETAREQARAEASPDAAHRDAAAPQPAAKAEPERESSTYDAGRSSARADADEADDGEETDEDDQDDDEDDDRESRVYERGGRGASGDRSNRRSGGFESLLRDSFRKAVERGLEVGIGTLKSADHVVRNVADEVKMPKEISNYLFSQIDETKNVLIRAVAGEVREFLDSTDLATEMQRALTALSFEIKMEIRFIPNEAGELKPKVKARAVPRARRTEKKPAPSDDES